MDRPYFDMLNMKVQELWDYLLHIPPPERTEEEKKLAQCAEDFAKARGFELQS